MSTDTIAGIIGGLVAACLGAWLSFRYQGKRISDKKLFENWHNAFRRKAFRGKFDWYTNKTNVDKFVENIKDLRLALSQGITKHNNPDNRGGSISQINNKQWRSDANEVLVILDEILVLADEKNRYDDKSAKEIDKKRDDIIRLFNPIWKKLKLDELVLPSESGETEP